MSWSEDGNPNGVIMQTIQDQKNLSILSVSEQKMESLGLFFPMDPSRVDSTPNVNCYKKPTQRSTRLWIHWKEQAFRHNICVCY